METGAIHNNYQNLTLDFIEFTKHISIGLEEINIIFKNDYIEGILEIIINFINNINDKTDTKDNNIILPIKAFNQKENNLYIYFISDRISKINPFLKSITLF